MTQVAPTAGIFTASIWCKSTFHVAPVLKPQWEEIICTVLLVSKASQLLAVVCQYAVLDTTILFRKPGNKLRARPILHTCSVAMNLSNKLKQGSGFWRLLCLAKLQTINDFQFCLPCELSGQTGDLQSLRWTCISKALLPISCSMNPLSRHFAMWSTRSARGTRWRALKGHVANNFATSGWLWKREHRNHAPHQPSSLFLVFSTDEQEKMIWWVATLCLAGGLELHDPYNPFQFESFYDFTVTGDVALKETEQGMAKYWPYLLQLQDEAAWQTYLKHSSLEKKQRSWFKWNTPSATQPTICCNAGNVASWFKAKMKLFQKQQKGDVR